MNSISLNNSQLVLLHKIERDSFFAYCNLINESPDELQAKLCKNGIQKIKDLINAVHIRAGKPARSYEKYLMDALQQYESDYWSLLRFSTYQGHEAAVDRLVDVGDKLNVNLPYLGSLSSELNINVPSPRTPEAFRAFLLSVPLLHQYDLTFNAFVSKKAKLGLIPCICVYQHLIDALDHFINIIGGAILTRNGNGYLVISDKAAISQLAVIPTFLFDCLSAIHFLLGRSAIAVSLSQYAFSKKHPDLLIELQILQAGARSFVKYHECGHLLLGHLQETACPQLEHQADGFSASVMFQSCNRNAAYTLELVSVLILFIVIEIIENIRCIKSSTHPPARLRFFHIFKQNQLGFLLNLYDIICALVEPSIRIYKKQLNDNLPIEDCLEQIMKSE